MEKLPEPFCSVLVLQLFVLFASPLILWQAGQLFGKQFFQINSLSTKNCYLEIDYGHKLRLSRLSGRRKKLTPRKCTEEAIGSSHVITEFIWGRYEREPTIKNMKLYEG